MPFTAAAWALASTKACSVTPVVVCFGFSLALYLYHKPKPAEVKVIRNFSWTGDISDVSTFEGSDSDDDERVRVYSRTILLAHRPAVLAPPPGLCTPLGYAVVERVGTDHKCRVDAEIA